MIKNISLLFILQIILKTGYSQDTIYLDKSWQPIDKINGSYYRIIKAIKNKQFRIEDYYLNGQLQMEGISSSKDSLVKNGEFKYYNRNSKYNMIVNYKNNIDDGKYELFYPTGEIREIGKSKNGKIDGKNIQYFINGYPKRLSFFKRGKYNGRMVYYNEYGIAIGKGQTKDDYWYGKWNKYNDNGSFLTHLYYYDCFKIKELKIKTNTLNYIWMYCDKEENDNSFKYFCRAINLKIKGKIHLEGAPEINLLIMKQKATFNIDKYLAQNKFDSLDAKVIEFKGLNFNIKDKNIKITKLYIRANNVDNKDYSEIFLSLLVKDKEIYLNITIPSEKLNKDEVIIKEFVENLRAY